MEAQQRRPFSVVDEQPDLPPQGIDAYIAPQKKPFIERAAIDMLQLALNTLGQRFTVALASLFTLVTVGSSFYLWLLIINEPTQLQITATSIYSGFVLLINYLNMRRGR